MFQWHSGLSGITNYVTLSHASGQLLEIVRGSMTVAYKDAQCWQDRMEGSGWVELGGDQSRIGVGLEKGQLQYYVNSLADILSLVLVLILS